ncbi:T9SS type A sorting domain-containing protein [Candidatus Kuenenbacteria bacterium]|nr:T9SS type A sorting domain-containing protein [Candidatus Kuenenbacteria bacterium]
MSGVTSVESPKIWALSVAQIAGVDSRATSPDQFTLSQNYPNPFNPSTNITYTLAKKCQVKLGIYNLRGELVETLVDTEQHAGNYTFTWNAINAPSGVYICRLIAEGGGVLTRKMTLMK